MIKIKLKISPFSSVIFQSMSIESQIKNMNEFIHTFLNRMVEDNVQDMIEEWDAPEVQEDFKKFFKKRSRKKDPNKPKRPKSTYLFFCKAMRAEVKADLGSDCKNTDVVSELGRRWHEFKVSKSRKDKKALATFKEEAEADKERYAEEIKDYVPTSEEELKKMKKKKKSGRPKRATSSYQYFCKDARSEIKEDDPDIDSKDIMKEIGRRWKALKASSLAKDKRALAKYEKANVKDKERYDAEMEKYNSSSEEMKDCPSPPVKKSKIKKTRKKSPKKKKKKSPKKKADKKESDSDSESDEEDDLEEENDEQPTDFDLYCQAHRKSVQHRYSSYTEKQVKFKMVQMWGKLSKKEKEEWNPATRSYA